MLKKFKAVLFDLDGTLVDTAPDLANALNYVLACENKPLVTTSEVYSIASDGVAGLLKLGFNSNNSQPDYVRLSKLLLDYYALHIAEKSCLFTGLDNIIATLGHNGILWGIVTNKAQLYTHKLLKELTPALLPDCVVCGDTLPERKPSPAPLFHAARLLNVHPQDCCYIGDAPRDIIAARAANMFSIAALYGYIPAQTNTSAWQADAYVQTPDELMNWIL